MNYFVGYCYYVDLLQFVKVGRLSKSRGSKKCISIVNFLFFDESIDVWDVQFAIFIKI